MKTIFAIGAAAALMAASSAANAQDCVNGWSMIKDQIPVRCGELPSAFSGHVQPLDEPLYTGSIGGGLGAGDFTTDVQPLPGQNRYYFARNREECAPGQYWMLQLESGDRPVAC